MLLIRYLLNFVKRIYEYYTVNTDYIAWSVVFRKYPYIIIQFTYYERLKKTYPLQSKMITIFTLYFLFDILKINYLLLLW